MSPSLAARVQDWLLKFLQTAFRLFPWPTEARAPQRRNTGRIEPRAAHLQLRPDGTPTRRRARGLRRLAGGRTDGRHQCLVRRGRRAHEQSPDRERAQDLGSRRARPPPQRDPAAARRHRRARARGLSALPMARAIRPGGARATCPPTSRAAKRPTRCGACASRSATASRWPRAGRRPRPSFSAAARSSSGPSGRCPSQALVVATAVLVFTAYDRLGPRRKAIFTLGVTASAQSRRRGSQAAQRPRSRPPPVAALFVSALLTYDYTGSTPIEGGSHFEERRWTIAFDLERCDGDLPLLGGLSRSLLREARKRAQGRTRARRALHPLWRLCRAVPAGRTVLRRRSRRAHRARRDPQVQAQSARSAKCRGAVVGAPAAEDRFPPERAVNEEGDDPSGSKAAAAVRGTFYGAQRQILPFKSWSVASCPYCESVFPKVTMSSVLIRSPEAVGSIDGIRRRNPCSIGIHRRPGALGHSPLQIGRCRASRRCARSCPRRAFSPRVMKSVANGRMIGVPRAFRRTAGTPSGGGSGILSHGATALLSIQRILELRTDVAYDRPPPAFANSIERDLQREVHEPVRDCLQMLRVYDISKE